MCDQKKGTTDAVEILDKLFVRGDPERLKAIEEERRKADREQEEFDETGVDPYE